MSDRNGQWPQQPRIFSLMQVGGAFEISAYTLLYAIDVVFPIIRNANAECGVGILQLARHGHGRVADLIPRLRRDSTRDATRDTRHTTRDKRQATRDATRDTRRDTRYDRSEVCEASRITISAVHRLYTVRNTAVTRTFNNNLQEAHLGGTTLGPF